MPPDRPLRSRSYASVSPRRLHKRVWGIGRLLFLAFALSLTFGAFFLTSMRIANRAREVRVPDILGLSLTDATARLDEIGLGIRVDSRRPDAKVAADHILGQEPEPEAVLRRQRAVRVRLSDGLKAPAVPDVVGQAERTADVVLAQADVIVSDRVEIRTASYPAGAVVAQDPAAKSRASSVALLVNRGETGAAFVMPDLIGTPGSRVVDVLRRRGFRVTVTGDALYPGITPGTVIRQTPQAGFQVAFGDPVLIEVSR